MKTLQIIAAAVGLATAISCCQNNEACQQNAAQPQENSTIETIMSRRSIRKYKQIPVSRDTLDIILECGINAPNGQNRQSWEVRVVDNPAVMEEIKEIMAAGNPDMKAEAVKGCFRDAPVMVFLARDPSGGGFHRQCITKPLPFHAVGPQHIVRYFGRCEGVQGIFWWTRGGHVPHMVRSRDARL